MDTAGPILLKPKPTEMSAMLATAPYPVTLHVVDSTREHPPRAPEAPEIDSHRLLRGQRELRIRHGNEYYRLRHTRNDKLILTK